jgi:hypothetical protein
MNLENFSKMRGLQLAHTSANTALLDHVLSSEQGDEIREKLLTKRIQFDTTLQLFEELESVCSLLECSKREFLEMAVVEALNKARSVFENTFKESTGQEFIEVFGVKEEA